MQKLQERARRYRPSSLVLYYVGLSIGLLFLSSFMVFSRLGVSSMLSPGVWCVLALLLFGICISCLIIKPLRFVGYGLLTVVLIIPVVIAISCGVAIGR